MKHPVVDMSACTLCMSCVEVCPEVFSKNDADFIVVADMDTYPQACVEEAIKYCPEDVISWEEQ